MIIDPFFSLVVGLTVIGAILLAPTLASKIRASEEQNRTALWQGRCSGRVGLIGISFPAIRVALYDDFLVIGFFGPTVIAYKSLAEVAVQKGIPFLSPSRVVLRPTGARVSYVLRVADPKHFVDLVNAHRG